jgi:hypothetical protein
MKKLKSLVSCLSLLAVMALTIVPAKSVYADTSGGPQGGSASGTTKPQTSQPGDDFLSFLIWLIVLLLLGK